MSAGWVAPKPAPEIVNCAPGQTLAGASLGDCVNVAEHTGRLARGFLHAEHVMLGLAIASSIQWMVAPELSEEPFWLALDAFWPLSMLGMAAIGIRIAIAGRWTGAARVWPLVAESWAPVNIPVAQLAPAAAPFTGAAHLVLGYAALGVVLMRRPELTGARD